MSSAPQASEGRTLVHGDHLAVRRPQGYQHHGIYVSDDRVIQFGGGVRGKTDATIEVVTLDEFERGAAATVVEHGHHGRFGMRLPKAESPDRIVQRAEWLFAHHPPRRRYNLIGNNCEHAANFCVAEYTESLQVRRFFLIKAAVGNLGLLYLAWRVRTGRSVPWRPTLSAEAISLFITGLYHFHIRRFWKDIGAEWRAWGNATDDAPHDPQLLLSLSSSAKNDCY